MASETSSQVKLKSLFDSSESVGGGKEEEKREKREEEESKKGGRTVGEPEHVGSTFHLKNSCGVPA